jgi:ankyrin repeat protein
MIKRPDYEMKSWILAALVFSAFPAAAALDRVEARHGGVSMSGNMTGAVDLQFGVHVGGTLDQKIDQLERELRLMQYARDYFPPLLSEISFSGTNLPMSQCLADLSTKVGKSIPMELGTNDFKAKAFVFEEITLLDGLKYLLAFDDAILDVSDGKLVCRPVRQALALDQPQYDLLQLMAARQYAAVEQILASQSVNVKGIQNHDGQTLLHLAAWRNQTRIAKRLIALGADIGAKDDVGYTPLHEAARDGNRECVELFLQNGADQGIPDNNNDTALETAIYYGHLDVAKLLADHGAKLDIYTASALGRVKEVQKFLDQTASPGAGKREGGSQETAPGRIILAHATDPLPKSRFSGFWGTTPLHCAARGGSVEVANLLVSRGESVSAKDRNGETPLFWAAEGRRLETAEFLVKHGADVNATNSFGRTPLLAAARYAITPELVNFLVKSGADVNARDDQGENALHKIAWSGGPERNVETAKILFDAGTDMAAKNKDGKTPFDVLLDNSLRTSALVEIYRNHANKTSSGSGK